MLGNIVHNFRSSPDQLVNAMVNANGHIPVDGPGGSAFPIKLKPLAAGQTFEHIYTANGKLAHVHRDHIALIAKYQPYTILAAGYPAEMHELATLGQLWQIDKHRHLNLTRWVMRPESRPVRVDTSDLVQRSVSSLY